MRCLPYKSNDMYVSMYPSSLNEKADYLNFLDIHTKLESLPEGLYTKITDILTYCPLLCISVSRPLNTQAIRLVFDVSIECTFRGAGAGTLPGDATVVPMADIAPYMCAYDAVNKRESGVDIVTLLRGMHANGNSEFYYSLPSRDFFPGDVIAYGSRDNKDLSKPFEFNPRARFAEGFSIRLVTT